MKNFFGNGDKDGLGNSSLLNDLNDDSYFEKRLDEVFNEMVQLKAGQSTANSAATGRAQQGDASLQTEVARLKEELNRTRSSQDLRSEMSILKSELGRDSYVLEEMRKINERLDSFQGGEVKKSPEGKLDGKPAAVGVNDEALKALLEEVRKNSADIKELLASEKQKAVNVRPFTAFDDLYAILISEIGSLREDILSKSGVTPPDSDKLLVKLDAIFDETIRLKSLVDKTDEDIRSEATDKYTDSALKDDIADVSAQIMTLREEVKASKIMEQDEVLREIEALKKEISEAKVYRSYISNSDSDEIQPTYSEANLMLSEIVSLRQEIQAYKDELTQKETSGFVGGSSSELKSTLEEMKDMVSRRSSIVINDDSGFAESSAINILLDEIHSLKDDMSSIKREIDSVKADKSGIEEIKNLIKLLADKEVEETYEAVESVEERGFSILFDEITALRTEVSGNPDVLNRPKAVQYVSSDGPLSVDGEALKAELEAMRKDIITLNDEPNLTVLHEVLELRDEFQAVKEALMATMQGTFKGVAPETVSEVSALSEKLIVLGDVISSKDNDISPELLTQFEALRDSVTAIGMAVSSIGDSDAEIAGEIKTLREQLFAVSMANVSDGENDKFESYNDILLNELTAFRDDFDAYKKMDVTVSNGGLSETLLNELTALRNDFDAYKTQNDERNGASTDDILGEIKTLKEQFFAVSMANVNDGDEEKFQNYNDIILDELFSLRDDFDSFKSSDNESLLQLLSERLEGLEQRIDSLASSELTQELRETFTEEIEALKKEIADRRTADEMTVNFMHEMALLLDRQNELISIGETQPKSRMEKLREEIAATIVTQDIPSKRDIEELARNIDRLKNNLTEMQKPEPHAETVKESPKATAKKSVPSKDKPEPQPEPEEDETELVEDEPEDTDSVSEEDELLDDEDLPKDEI